MSQKQIKREKLESKQFFQTCFDEAVRLYEETKIPDEHKQGLLEVLFIGIVTRIFGDDVYLSINKQFIKYYQNSAKKRFQNLTNISKEKL